MLNVIGLLFLSLTVEALQGKRCQDSLLSGGVRSVRAKMSEGRGRPRGIFFGFYTTRHILLSDSANCTVIRVVVLTQYRRVTDGQSDGLAIASTTLAKRRAVKIGERVFFCRGTASVESAANRVETVSIDSTVQAKLKTFLFTASYGVSENNI